MWVLFPTNGEISLFQLKCIDWKGEFCPLVEEFYPFVGIDSVGGINYNERIKFYVIMVVGVISNKPRNFSVSVKIYWLKRKIFSIHGKWYWHSTHTYVFRWSAKLNSKLLMVFCGIDSEEWMKFSVYVKIYSLKRRICRSRRNRYHKTLLTVLSLISPTDRKHYTSNFNNSSHEQTKFFFSVNIFSHKRRISSVHNRDVKSRL